MRSPFPCLTALRAVLSPALYYCINTPQSTKKQLLNAYPDNITRPSKADAEDEALSLEAAAVAGLGLAVEGDPVATELASAAEGGGSVREGIDGEKIRLSAACQLLGLSEGFELNGTFEQTFNVYIFLCVFCFACNMAKHVFLVTID